MKHKLRILPLFLLTLGLCSLFTGCKEPVVTVHYYVDGELSNTAPDWNFYDFQSIETENENATATWDSSTWALSYENVKKDTIFNVYFVYTASPFKINGTGYASLQDAFASITDTEPVIVETTADFKGFGATPVGSDVTLRLNGFTIDGEGFDTITCNGTLVIEGEGTITNTTSGEYSKSIANYGNLTLNNVTVLNTTTNVAIWNSNNGGSILNINDCIITRSELDRIVILNSGQMHINSGEITGNGDKTHPVIYNNTDIAELYLNGGTITNTNGSYTIYSDAGKVYENGAIYTNTYGISTEQ